MYSLRNKQAIYLLHMPKALEEIIRLEAEFSDAQFNTLVVDALIEKFMPDVADANCWPPNHSSGSGACPSTSLGEV